ncbi:ABC transporter permease [Clostridium oryzae]|uniref:FtsX-like permease family protein n=1 Tax=Clostridium oryzae TaxID=1450648 RepID=A0A1V4ICG8_9CLOT|nr:ABC transporter permease [Clostridium oryzae]OPJ57702.1 FtsX-like permease family protein [Clostridium oryzae]
MWIKNFRHKKLQTLMIFMIIMLCSMLLIASVSILVSLNKPFKKLAKECHSATAVVYPYSTDDKDVNILGQQFVKLTEVKKVEYVRIHYITERLSFEDKKIKGFIDLTKYNASVFGKIRYLQGNKSAAEKLKNNECIIPACISNEYNIKIGDSIKLELVGGDVDYKVRGIYADPYNTSSSFDSNILTKELPKGVSQKLCVYLYGKKGITGSKLQDAFRKKHDGQMNGQMVTLQQTVDSSLIAAHIVGSVFLAIGIIMLFVSCIIINFMIKSAMIADSKSIAVYKTMGYTSSDILNMYLKFYFAVVSLGCIIGIGSSVFLSDIILASVFKNMGQSVDNNILALGIPGYIIIVGFVLGIIYRIIGKTKNVKPVYALNGMSNSNTHKKKEYKGDSKMQFSPIGIALRTLMRNKKGAAHIVITCIVTIFSINFAVVSLDVAHTLKSNNDYWLGVDKCDVMVSITDSKQYKKVENIIRKDKRVNYYLESNMSKKIAMKWKKGMDDTIISGFVFNDFSRTKLPIVEGRNPKASNEIAIASKVAGELHKTVGDYMQVYLQGGKSVNFLITGIFQTYYQLGYACRLTKSAYTDNNYRFNYDHFSIYLKNKNDMKAFMKDIKKKIKSSGNVFARTEAFSSIMDMIVAPQNSAIPPVVAVVLLVGAINIFCIVLLKNASSKRINGIYKCLGYSTWHLILSNLYYVGIIAAASIVVALPLIVNFYPLIMRTCLAMFGFLKYPVTYNYYHIALANLVVFIFFIMSTMISSRSLKKVSVRELVQE